MFRLRVSYRSQRFHKSVALLLILLIALSLPSVRAESGEQEPVQVGLSIVGNSTAWFTELIDHTERSAENYNMEIITNQLSEGDASWQKASALALLTQGIDYMILFPYALDICDDIYAAAQRSGIPLILVCGDSSYRDRCDIMIYVDYRTEGKMCAQVLTSKFGNTKRSILAITGMRGSHIEELRMEGFMEYLEQYPLLEVTALMEGSNNRVKTSNDVSDYLTRSPENIPDAIFSCCDEDGIGALNALKLSGYTPNKDTFIVSANGTQDALKALIADEYCATVLSCKNLGAILTLVIDRYEHGYRGIDYLAIPYHVYDETSDSWDLNSALYW